MIPYLTTDGGTMPFYGIATYPPGAYDALTDTTWFVWESYSPSNGLRGIRIRGYDHTAESWLPARSIATHPLVDDDHGVPSVCVDDEGHIHVFGGCHNSDVFHWSSDAPGDHTAWTLQHTFSGDYSYPHPVLVGTALWLILRETDTPGSKMPAVYFTTSALAAGVPTWGSENPLVDLGADSRVYVGTTIVDGTDVHFTATRANFADSSRQHAYHFVLDTTTGDVRNTSGSVTIDAGDLPVDLTEANTSFRVHAHTGGNFGTLPSIAFDSSDVLHMVFADGASEPVAIKHTRFTAGAWTTPAATGATTDIGDDGVHVSDPILVALAAGEMAVFYSEDTGADWDWGGNVRRVVRSSGGTWGSSELIAEAVDRAYHQICAVTYAHEDARVMIAQRAQTDADTEGFDFKVYAYGDAGFLYADEPTVTLSLTTNGLIDYWNLNGAPDQWRNFTTGDWTAGSGNSLSVVAVTGGNLLRVTRSGSGSATIGFIRNNDVGDQTEVFVFARMVRSAENRFGVSAHITDLTAGSEDGVVLNIRGATSAAGGLLEVNAAVQTTLEASSNFAAAEQNYSFALYANNDAVVGWDELTNNDYTGTTTTQVSGRVGVWRSIDTVGGFVGVRQFFALLRPALAVSGLESGDDVTLRDWLHTDIATDSESAGAVSLDLLKVAPHNGVEVAIDRGGDQIVYDRVPGSGEFILGGSEYEVVYPPFPPTLGVTTTHEAANLTIPVFVPNPSDPDAVHVETVWQIAGVADVNFEDPLLDETVTGSLLAYVTEAILSASTSYRGRAKTNTTTVDGHWSEPVIFTTQPPLPLPEDPVLSDPPTDIEEDEVTLTVDAFDHAEGVTTAELYDPLTNDLPYPFARQWQVTETADTTFSDPVVDTELTSNIDLERTFSLPDPSTTYRARTRVQDGKYGTVSDWSNVVVFATDATPVDRPAQPTITATCTGRGATLAADPFDPFGAETHVLTQWRARPELDSGNGSDSFQSAVFLTSFNGWTALPMGTWLFDVRYKGSNGKWSLWSVPDTCDVYDRPPTPLVESPVSGKVISASQLVTISMPPVIDEDWDFVWQARQEGGTWLEVQNSAALTYSFPIVGKPNGFFEVRVQACYPTGHDAEGVCSDWAVLKLRIDRTGIRAVSYSFVGLNDPDEVPGDPLLIWDDEDNDVTAELVDGDLLSEGPSVGILMRNNQVLSTRQGILAFRELGKPVAGRFTTQFSIVPRERGVWWGWKWSQTHFMRAGIGYRAIGTGATDRSGLQFVARSGIQPYPFFPQTTEGIGDRGTCICEFPGADPSCSWCIVNGTPCEPCTTCHGMPTSCSCVSAAADVAKRSRLGSGGVLYEYGISYGRGGIERFGRVQGSGSLQFYQNATIPEEGFLARGLGVSTSIADPDTGDCNWWFTRYTMEVDVARESNQWRVKVRLLGPGVDSDAWTQNALVDLGETDGSVPCGYCGLALYHVASNLTDDHGVLFHSFAASDLEYEDCEAPPLEPTGCNADWRLTTFLPDDVTPQHGVYSGDFLTGVVLEADYYDNRNCPRPFLMPVKNFSETSINYAAGSSDIGQVRVGVLDKRLTPADQTTGIVTSIGDDYIGRRALLERWREDLGYVTVIDGVIESDTLDESMSVRWLNIRDPRERERDVALFDRNETFALWPESGPIASYGQLPNDMGYLLTPAQPADALEFERISGPGGDAGIHYGFVTLSSAIGEDAVYIEKVVQPFGEPVYNAQSNYYIHADITVRWRPAAGGDWVYLRDMPSRFTTNAIQGPSSVFPFSQFVWKLYMASTVEADIPDDTDLVDIQILAAKTTDATPFFWDNGTLGTLALEILRGEHTKNPPSIRYSEDAFEEWALNTPSVRFVAREPVKNMRDWLEKNVYAAYEHAPSFDSMMRIVPSQWSLPPADEELVELHADWLIPVGQWSHEAESVVNKVSYTYIRESVAPPDLSGGLGTVLSLAVNHETLRDIYGNAEWTRLVEQEVVRRYEHVTSMELFGTKEIEYEPVTIRSTGLLGEAILAILGVDTADRIADRIGNNVLSRFAYGAHEFHVEVRSGMAHGPGFDPYTLDLQVGQWVKVRASWLPNYETLRRSTFRYMQISAIADLDIGRRRLRLIDGGPVVEESLEGLSDDPDVLPFLEPPEIYDISETSDLRVEVSVIFPVDAPAGYIARVDYAVSVTEPSPTSGAWQLVGYLSAEGSILTPVIPAGSTVWIRARGEAVGRRPSVWTDALDLTLSDTPALLSLGLTFAADGLVQLEFVPNDFAGGVEIEVSTGAIGHTPSFGAFDEVDADPSASPVNLTGEEIGYGEELYARVTAWETFSLGSVGGTEGVEYIVKITRPQPAEAATHEWGAHTDVRFGEPENRTDQTAGVWDVYEQKWVEKEVAILPIDIVADTTGTLTVARGGTGLTALGSALQLLRTNAAATLMEWWTLVVNLATQVSGLLGRANGGTGVDFSSLTGHGAKLLRANVAETAFELWTLTVNAASQITGVLPEANGGVPAGGNTGQVLTKDSNSDHDASWQTPSSGSGVGASASVKLTTGNITFNNTSWTEISSSLRLTIAAAAGDRILVGAAFYADAASNFAGVEAFTLDSSNARVTAFTAGGASDFGTPCWSVTQSAVTSQGPKGGSPAPLTLASGDIDSGNVKVGFFYRQGTGANGTFRAGTTQPFVVWAINLDG